jgi:hypothetical protein
MDPGDISRLAHEEWAGSSDWFKYEAYLAFKRGHYTLIPGRPGTPHENQVYLGRFWRTQPLVSKEDRLDSQNSCLLHFFAEPDSDGALHDHPFQFRTRILKGAYCEYLPPVSWEPGDPRGPEYGTRSIWRSCGEMIGHDAPDLHAVGIIAPDTWTEVITGTRVRDWGFHPHNEQWVEWHDYLGIPR